MLGAFARMHTSTRNKLGVALIALAVVGAAALHFFGVQLVGLMDSQTTGSMTMIFLKLHWSVLALGVMSLAGVLCIVLPPRRPNSHGPSSP